MIYDDMNCYYNYILQKICNVRPLSNKLCNHLTMGPFFFYAINLGMEFSKIKFIARMSFI